MARRKAAEPPIAAQITGITATSRASRRGSNRRSPAVRIVVGHGTPNEGARGYDIPDRSPSPG